MKSKFSILVVLVLLFVILCCASCNRLINDGTGDQYETHASQPTDSDDTTDTSESTEPVTTELATESTESTTSQPEEPTDPVEAAIKDATDELISKGWTDIEVIEGEPDSIKRWGVVIEPYNLKENSILYSVIGQSGYMSSVIRIVYDANTLVAEHTEVYYTAKSGRELKGVHLESFLNTRSKPNEILSANDKEMYDYLCNDY